MSYESLICKCLDKPDILNDINNLIQELETTKYDFSEIQRKYIDLEQEYSNLRHNYGSLEAENNLLRERLETIDKN